MSGASSDWTLYGLFRTDLASLTPGKALAQAMHCGKHADHWIRAENRFGGQWQVCYAAWERETVQGFGTSLTLAVPTGDKLREIVAFAAGAGFPAGVTHDPTYPLQDGLAFHLLPLDTCGFVFGSRAALRPLLSQFGLHP